MAALINQQPNDRTCRVVSDYRLCTRGAPGTAHVHTAYVYAVQVHVGLRSGHKPKLWGPVEGSHGSGDHAFVVAVSCCQLLLVDRRASSSQEQVRGLPLCLIPGLVWLTWLKPSTRITFCNCVDTCMLAPLKIGLALFGLHGSTDTAAHTHTHTQCVLADVSLLFQCWELWIGAESAHCLLAESLDELPNTEGTRKLCACCNARALPSIFQTVSSPGVWPRAAYPIVQGNVHNVPQCCCLLCPKGKAGHSASCIPSQACVHRYTHAHAWPRAEPNRFYFPKSLRKSSTAVPRTRVGVQAEACCVRASTRVRYGRGFLTGSRALATPCACAFISPLPQSSDASLAPGRASYAHTLANRRFPLPVVTRLLSRSLLSRLLTNGMTIGPHMAPLLLVVASLTAHAGMRRGCTTPLLTTNKRRVERRGVCRVWPMLQFSVSTCCTAACAHAGTTPVPPPIDGSMFQLQDKLACCEEEGNAEEWRYAPPSLVGWITRGLGVIRTHGSILLAAQCTTCRSSPPPWLPFNIAAWPLLTWFVLGAWQLSVAERGLVTDRHILRLCCSNSHLHLLGSNCIPRLHNTATTLQHCAFRPARLVLHTQ